jgi:hypothetical protein
MKLIYLLKHTYPTAMATLALLHSWIHIFLLLEAVHIEKRRQAVCYVTMWIKYCWNPLFILECQCSMLKEFSLVEYKSGEANHIDLLA